MFEIWGVSVVVGVGVGSMVGFEAIVGEICEYPMFGLLETVDSPSICLTAVVLERLTTYKDTIEINNNRYVKANRFSFEKPDLMILLEAKEGKFILLKLRICSISNLRSLA